MCVCVCSLPGSVRRARTGDTAGRGGPGGGPPAPGPGPSRGGTRLLSWGLNGSRVNQYPELYGP